jgi:hypothetical protein
LSFSGLLAEAPLFVRVLVQAFTLAVPPLLLVRFVLSEPLRAYGLTWGRPRAWSPWVAGLLVLAVPLLIGATRIPEVHAAYPAYAEARSRPWLLVPSTLGFGSYGLVWELFFRGFVVLGLRERIGFFAVLVQAVPCALLHAGKPGIEVLASFPAALLLGTLSYRTGSVLPGWLLHLGASATVNLACVFWR